MSRSEHDVIILGGGVNGAGIARDCSLRGMRVLLVDKNDLAKGASGANTGMIHGGIRYLLYDVHTTKMSCADSGYIQAIAPHLLFRIPFLFPVFQEDKMARLFLEGAEIFFEAYDVYQPLKHGKPHTRLTANEVRILEPGLSENVIGAVTMDEWGIDPFRLTIANAIDAATHGAELRTYTDLLSFVKDASGTVVGVLVEDRITGTRETHSAPVVINATGAWGPRVAALAGAEYKIRPGKGVHIVYSHRISNYGIVMTGVDGRQMFLMPHQNGSIVGTTDDDYYGDLDNPVATEDEVRYILQAARRIFPSIDNYRMSRTYVGIRPTLYAWGKNEDRLSREHAFYDHTSQGVPGLISIAGGKLAAYRQLAEEVTDLVALRLGVNTPCRTHLEPLPGADSKTDVTRWASSFGGSPLSVSRMAYRHGSRAQDVLQLAKANPAGALQTCLCEPVTEAEVRYTCQQEVVRRLHDVRRRTRLSMGACGGTRCLARASQIVAEEKDWSAPEQLVELGDAMTGRFLGKRPVLEGANLATEEMGQAMHFLTANLGPFLEAAREELGRRARVPHASADLARRANESVPSVHATGGTGAAKPQPPLPQSGAVEHTTVDSE